jgi:hypothetical protein
MDLLSQSVKIADLASNGHLSELLAKKSETRIKDKKTKLFRVENAKTILQPYFWKYCFVLLRTYRN